tara:strand:+ start:533 stop:751 length:219 start_codon:yes stop_codon:yes gene_type:complete
MSDPGHSTSEPVLPDEYGPDEQITFEVGEYEVEDGHDAYDHEDSFHAGGGFDDDQAGFEEVEGDFDLDDEQD